jgi:hypothetical protein
MRDPKHSPCLARSRINSALLLNFFYYRTLVLTIQLLVTRFPLFDYKIMSVALAVKQSCNCENVFPTLLLLQCLCESTESGKVSLLYFYDYYKYSTRKRHLCIQEEIACQCENIPSTVHILIAEVEQWTVD